MTTACTTAVGHAHISCYASAQQLLCDRWYWLSQQHILSLPTTWRGWIINLWYTLLVWVIYMVGFGYRILICFFLFYTYLYIGLWFIIIYRSSDSLSFVQNRINFFCYQFRRDILHTCEVSPSARLVTIDTARAAR